MSETLFIRLGSQEHDPIQWLIWSVSESEIIASGELKQASDLSHLTEKSQHRQVIGFVPANDIAIKSLKVPGNSSRAITAAAPYMLEDDLAQDVESLFFAYSHNVKDDNQKNSFIAAVEKEQLVKWTSWFSDANITCKTLIPDVLAMPVSEGQWSAIRFNEQILVRQSQWKGLSVETNVWSLISKTWAEQSSSAPEDDNDTNEQDSDSSKSVESENVTINAYSNLPDVTNVTIQKMPEELPLALLAQHVDTKLINLLQGEFQVKEQRSSTYTNWLWVASIAVCALLVNVGLKSTQLIQLNNQVEALESNIISTYKETFPQTKRVRVSTIKSQLTRKLSEVGGSSEQAGFLLMLNEIQSAFKQVSELKPESLKFDAKRKEIRLQATSAKYQSFDNFKIALEKSDFKVSQGAQNNLGDQVSGSFIISAKGGR
jgi:general secretion pathway protein L